MRFTALVDYIWISIKNDKYDRKAERISSQSGMGGPHYFSEIEITCFVWWPHHPSVHVDVGSARCNSTITTNSSPGSFCWERRQFSPYTANPCGIRLSFDQCIFSTLLVLSGWRVPLYNGCIIRSLLVEYNSHAGSVIWIGYGGRRSRLRSFAGRL